MRGDEDVPRGDVAVDKLLGLEVGERGGELRGVGDQGNEIEPRPVVLQVGAELAVSGPPHDDPDGGLGADADQLDDVLVVELLHDVWSKTKRWRVRVVTVGSILICHLMTRYSNYPSNYH